MSHSLLDKYRRILDRIHDGGNIFYDRGRMDAYILIAKFNSDFRRELDVKEARNQQ
jgi:hypothetical protein